MRIINNFNYFTIEEILAAYVATDARFIIEDGKITKVRMELTTATNEK